ncbi:glycosyltransferase family 2 protein [Chloroflexota bacterium]
MAKEKPLLSIVITSYTLERLKDIFELLHSVPSQTYPNIEIIFVAERSRQLYDRVKAYIDEEGMPNVNIIFNEGEPGVSVARNLGIKHAKGSIISFIDDDALPFPDWAEKMVKTYDNDSIIGVTGPAFPLWEEESMAWFPEEFHWLISCTAWADWSELTEVRNVWGMNMSFRREAFEQCRLFSTTFGLNEGKGAVAEENDLSVRVRRETGKCIVYNPEVEIRHKVYKHRLTWNFIARRSYQIGRSRRILSRLHSRADNSAYPLKVEQELLKRIFRRLLPTILVGFFHNPLSAWRRFSVTVIALFFVALGYFLGKGE